LSLLHRAPSFCDLALGALRRAPDRLAFTGDCGPVSYRAAHGRVSQFARVLAARGVGPSIGVVMLTGNIPEYFFVLLAATALGARVSALHPLGSAEDHAFVIDDAEASVYVFNPRQFDDHSAAVLGHLSTSPTVLSLGPSSWAEDACALADGEPAGAVRAVATSDDILGLAYSSGTTGTPKGVIQKHRSVVEMTTLSMPGWQLPTSDFRFLAATPISHASQCFVVPCWINGGTVVLHSDFDPERFLRGIEEHAITTTFVVPSMVYALLDAPGIGRFDGSPLTNVVYGAAPMAPARLAEALDRFGPVFVQLYGQAEAPACVTALRKEDHDLDRPDLLASCGQALPGVTVELHDDDDREIPVGEVGEICVRSPLVSEGYWKRPELTAETYRNDWLHTGDLARRDESGYYFIVDRKKDMIITGGMNVFPAEVERVLTSHPSVANAAVIGVPDDRWGESVLALVVLRPERTVDAAELQALVRQRKGPVFTPKVVEFIETIPVTPIGKPDKLALRSRYWAGEGRQVH
jgi:fatty-acyl-CoA synthase